MMFGRFFLLFTIVPLVELFLLIRLGGIIGALWTVLLVIGTGALGAYLTRQQGWKVWNQIQTELQVGRFPAGQMIDGLLLLVAGAVLITPGIITDALGLILLFPATRAPIRKWVTTRLQRMVANGNVSVSGFWGAGGAYRRPGSNAAGSNRPPGADPFGTTGRSPYGERNVTEDGPDRPLSDDERE